jgi:tetratricopeptide (TPR) repeat protein
MTDNTTSISHPFDPALSFLKNVNELDLAKLFLKTLAKYANTLEQFDYLGRWYHAVKDYDSSLYWTEKALVVAPDNQALCSVRSNLAKLHNHRNEPDKALFYLGMNVITNGSNYEISLERVFSLFLLNRKVESEAILREMLFDRNLPENIRLRVEFNLGTYDLMHGKFKAGLRGFLITGKRLGIWKDAKLPFKFWDGGVQPGKTIVILAEGGIGDEFISVRFMQHLISYGMHPVWYTTRPDMLSIFKRCGFDVTDHLDNFSDKTLWTYSMSLPVYLDLDIHQLWDKPYIRPDPQLVQKYQPSFNTGKIKIGIKWSGNPDYEQDLHRKVNLLDLATVVCQDYTKVYSLQKDDFDDLNTLDKSLYPITNLANSLDSYEDTLAVMANMDIIVTSCTSVAHAASSMGLRTIVLVPITAYYTWCSSDKDIDKSLSLWYGQNTTIIRQVTHRSWDEPMEQLKALIGSLNL